MPQSLRTVERIALVASPTDEARSAHKRLAATYGEVAPEEADVIVALGGDGHDSPPPE